MEPFVEVKQPTAPEPEVQARMLNNSAFVADGHSEIDRREDKAIYASSTVPGSSAIYAQEGGTIYLDHPEIHGWAPMTDEDKRNELASKYGFCAAVLANCKTTNITLESPTIVCHENSNANGAYAIFGGAVVIHGGSISTNNGLGHGVDASYGGFIYLDGTTIHTGGTNSGALATDFQGGYITVKNIHAVTERPGSPGIYTAGKSIISAYDSTFISKGCEAVMLAHSLGHTYLYNCHMTGTVGLNCHNGGGEDFSYLHMIGGTVTATAGSTLMCDGGNGVMDLTDVTFCGNDGNITFAKGGSKLVAILRDMAVTGDCARGEKSFVAVYLKNTSLKGAVNITELHLAEDAVWQVTGDSSAAVLDIAPGAVICAAAPVTVRYGALAEGCVLPKAENVTFASDDGIVDDYEAVKMGPPPGAGPGGPGGPGMPGMPGGPEGGMPGGPGM